jgi:hypothetical protein
MPERARYSFWFTAMGILDDAIREHLELIRRRGAADSEVQRLEDEAFGPPTRPDEADFPGSEEPLAASGNGVAVQEPPPEGAGAHEDVTTLLPAEESGAAAAQERVGEPDTGDQEHIEPAAEAPAEVHAEEAQEASLAAEEVEQDEPAAEERPIVEEEEAPSEPYEEPSEEASLPPEQGTALYDQTRDELDLQREDERAAEEPPSEELPAVEPEGTMPLEPPIESLDTVEHPFPDEITEPEAPHEGEEPSDEYAVADEGTAPEHVEDSGEGEEEEEGESDEDVLADTPEFLKDAPEDDELWFEQGEPKDFDF